MARILGVAQTTLGLGLLVEKITDPAGNIAPTVADLARQGLVDDGFFGQLDEFFADLADAHNAAGKQGLYLIDGFGVLPLIPLYAWSKSLNRKRIARKYKEMRDALLERIQDTGGA
ncbi:hypothetical protein G6F60_014710 [Rhizopus arrhizus]|nr:hypothetical protein G6F60_014710 [Rhizopus arrhizus]